MRALVLILGLISQTLWAAPNSGVGKSDDGMTFTCSTNEDVGVWAYRPTDIQTSEAGGKLAIHVSLDFMRCATAGNSVAWVPRDPFQAISRTIDGKVEIVWIDQVNAVLFDGDNYDRMDIPANHQTSQSFNFTVDETEIQKIVDQLKPGQSFSKKYYFLMENHEVRANGAASYVSSGAYDVDITWTKSAATVSRTAHIN